MTGRVVIRAPQSTATPAPAPERLDAGLDLRLMVPALSGWVTTAVTLGWSVEARSLLGATSLVLAGALTALGVRRRGPASEPSLTALPLAALSLAAVALTLTASVGHDLVRRAGPVDDLAAGRTVVKVHGQVLSDPRTVGSAGTGRSTVVLRVRLTSVEGRGERSEVSAPVLVLGNEAWSTLRWHDRIRASGRLEPVPDGEDVVADLRALGAPLVTGRPGFVRGVAEHMRAGLRSATAHLPADARGLLPGLVIGDTSRTPADLTEAMRATGMTHLSAVSGSNVAIVLSVVLGGCGLVGVPRWARPWLALTALAWFVVLARPDPSVVRAATMGGVGLIGMSRSRRGAGMPVLAAAVLVLITVDPWLARSYGFALSTLATLGLLVFVRPWGEAIGVLLPRCCRRLGPTIAIPVAAQVMCAPVIVLLQGSVSVVGVVANLAAAPLVAPATIAGVAAALVALVNVTLATWLAWVGALPTLGIARVARLFSEVPGGTAPWPDGPGGALLLAVLSVMAILTARWVLHAGRRHVLVALAVVVALVAGLAPTRALTWPPADWHVVVCDVGQGDAVVLESAPGHAVLVDTGPEPRSVDRCLDRLDVETLDAIVLTHFHADHVDGLAGAVRGRQVAQILTTPVQDPPQQAVDVHALARRRGIPVGTLVAGDHLALGEVTAQVWWPARRIDAGSVPNNASVVLAARVGPVRILLTGDIEREAAHEILLMLRRDPRMARAAHTLDVVKSPHHGSSNLDEDLMATVRAPVGIISVGKDNDYGHPTARHLEVLRSNGYAVYRTDERGDVAVTVTSGRVVVVTAR